MLLTFAARFRIACGPCLCAIQLFFTPIRVSTSKGARNCRRYVTATLLPSSLSHRRRTEPLDDRMPEGNASFKRVAQCARMHTALPLSGRVDQSATLRQRLGRHCTSPTASFTIAESSQRCLSTHRPFHAASQLLGTHRHSLATLETPATPWKRFNVMPRTSMCTLVCRRQGLKPPCSLVEDVKSLRCSQPVVAFRVLLPVCAGTKLPKQT